MTGKARFVAAGGHLMSKFVDLEDGRPCPPPASISPWSAKTASRPGLRAGSRARRTD